MTQADINFVYDALLLSTRPHGECIIYGSNPNVYGRYDKRIPSSDKVVRVYAHRIALLKKMDLTAIPYGLEASHLCHTKACVKLEHLTAEPHGINMNRQLCFNETKLRGQHVCFGHGQYPPCK